MNIRLSRMRDRRPRRRRRADPGAWPAVVPAPPAPAVAAAAGAPTDGTLTVGLLGDIGQPPDPDIYYANNGIAIMINAYEGLVQYKNNTDKVEIAPRLATSWDVNPDHTTSTPSTCARASRSTTAPRSPPPPSTSRSSAGSRSKGGAAYMVEAVKSVATPDDHTAVITLNQPEHRVPELPGLAVRPEDGVARRA